MYQVTCAGRNVTHDAASIYVHIIVHVYISGQFIYDQTIIYFTDLKVC
jgi:hypothetical protein